MLRRTYACGCFQSDEQARELPWWILRARVPDGGASVQDIIAQDEGMRVRGDGDDHGKSGEPRVRCETCGAAKRVAQSLMYEAEGGAVVVCIDRFAHVGTACVKRTAPLLVSEQLEWSDATWSLRGVVEHRGAANAGHYVCYIREARAYIEYDDTRVLRHRRLPRPVATGCYMLLYERDTPVVARASAPAENVTTAHGDSPVVCHDMEPAARAEESNVGVGPAVFPVSSSSAA